jgi:DNA-directed RNA polymerase beta' subunit
MTCLGTKKTCPGHNGYIKLRFPLFSPMFFKQIIKVLKKICHGCGLTLTVPKSG